MRISKITTVDDFNTIKRRLEQDYPYSVPQDSSFERLEPKDLVKIFQETLSDMDKRVLNIKKRKKYFEEKIKVYKNLMNLPKEEK